jgi:endo-1,4-beta-xylanase
MEKKQSVIHLSSSRCKSRLAWWSSLFLGGMLTCCMVALSGCAVETEEEVVDDISSLNQALAVDTPTGGCGFELTWGARETWHVGHRHCHHKGKSHKHRHGRDHLANRCRGYHAWIDVTNVSGDPASDFELLLDIDEKIVKTGLRAEFTEVDGGYRITAPSWLRRHPIAPGKTYRIFFTALGEYNGFTPYLISINGIVCDQMSPEIILNVTNELVTADETLTLTADAVDNVAIWKVIFEQDGEVIGEDDEAPYSLDVVMTDELNGRHHFTAKAVDPSGNEATAEVSVLVAIGNRFFGTAPHHDSEYETIPAHFNQITPGNAGKWGSVESVRDEMNWSDLDTAYQFAKDNGYPFKLHTLIWGSQQPNWVADLSVDEQLEELDEWMGALAERYPDLDLIDVVNEPLHAPPVYKEALGGDGDTGWDWVVTAFEMAREHFPNSELILNDYNIVVLAQFTYDYLTVINVLQTRGLIDGIGVQAHFLERAEIDEVTANLEVLAATGLPIYVSELDVNLANDAHQANRMRDLVTVFLDNPSVLGITHWGHLEGFMWRENAFLIREDGTSRPALDWLDCYLAGGANCSVPEYVPLPKVGSEVKLGLEAEAYDAASGIIAAGDVVAYTDNGDWLRFDAVTFNETYNTFYIKYAKGNEEVGSLSIHLDTLDSDAVLTVELPPTDGWGSVETVALPWTPVSGAHDLYLQFHDTYGVANVDYLEFSRPLREGDEERIDLEAESYDYQQGIDDYGAIIGGADTGDYLVYANVVVQGYTLFKALYGRGADGPGVVEVHLDALDGPVAASFPTPNTGGWNTMAEVEGTLDISPGTHDLYVVFTGDYMGNFDRFSLVNSGQGPNLVANGTFEAGTTGWNSWGGTLEVSTALVHNGAQSLLVTNRTGGSENAIYDLLGAVTPGVTYNTAFWVTVDGAAAEEQVNVTAKIVCDGSAEYRWLSVDFAVTNGEWVELAGPLAVPDCDLGELIVYVEGPSAGVDLYVDDVSVRPPATSNLVANGTFESGTTGWSSWGGTLEATTALVHGGAQSLLVTNRTSGSENAIYDLSGIVTADATYNTTVWAAIDGAADAERVNVTSKVVCDGSAEYSWLSVDSAVTNGNWIELAGPLVIPSCDLGEVLIYVEGPSAGVDLYVDDVVISP